MKLKYLTLLPLVVLAVGLGVLLVPRENELALMSLKAKRFTAAEPFYEQQRDLGDQSIATVIPLTEIYLNDGRVDEAIGLLEAFVTAQPDNLEARRYLGQLYNDAQRLDDYGRNLAALNELSPSEGQLRELIDIHERNADVARQISALQTLISRYGGTAEDYHSAALLLASGNALSDAAATLQVLAAREPELMTEEMRELLFRLLLDTGATSEAVALAREWAAGDISLDEIGFMTSELLGRGEVGEAYTLFQPYLGSAAGDPSLQPLLLGLHMARGESAEAVALLQDWHRRGQLTDESLAEYVSLSLVDGGTDVALLLTRSDSLQGMAPELLAQMVEDAFGEDAYEVVQQVAAHFEAEDLAERPLVGAKVAVAKGDRDEARQWAAIARRNSVDSLEAGVELAEILMLLDRNEDALEVVDALVDDPKAPAFAFEIVARLYLALGKAEQGFAKLERLREAGHPGFHHAGWAMLATRAGQADVALQWLASGPQVHADVLEDITYLALEADAPPLALMAAERLFALKGGPQERLALAEALLSVDRAADALPHLRTLVGDVPSAEPLFVRALQAAGSREELATFLSLQEASNGGLMEPQLVYDLLDGDEAPDYLVPFVERLAAQDGGDWFYTYAELVQRTGKQGRFAAFLEKELQRSDLKAEDVQVRLDTLFELEPLRALVTAERLASQDPERWSRTYLDLVQTAGDTPRLREVLQRRLASRNAPVQELEALAYSLIDAGDTSAALPTARRLAVQVGGDWVYTYADLAMKAGRDEELADFLAREIRRRDLNPEVMQARVDMFVTTLPRQAAAVIGPLADENPKRWFVPYFELMQKLGDTDGIAKLIDRRLETQDVPRGQLEGLIYSLLNANNLEGALPSVRHMAETLGGDWAFTFVDVARRTGRKRDAVNFLNHQLNRENLPQPAFEDLVALLIATDPIMAVAILKQHAKASGGLWYEVYNEALLKVRPRHRRLASSLKAKQLLAESVGREWLFDYAKAARKEGKQDELLTFLNAEAARTDLEPENAEIIAQLLAETR